MSAQPARPYLGIGEVLAKLRGEVPDISVSKIRFLESAGLIAPARIATMRNLLVGKDPLTIEVHFHNMTSLMHTYMAHIPTISDSANAAKCYTREPNNRRSACDSSGASYQCPWERAPAQCRLSAAGEDPGHCC